MPHMQRYTQLVSLTSFMGRQLDQRCPARHQRAASSHAVAEVGSTAERSMLPAPLIGLQSPLIRLQQSSRRRHSRGSAKRAVSVSAGVLQAPIHHVTLAQLSARFMVSCERHFGTA